MARSILDIIIKLSKTGNSDKETITGLVKLKSAYMEAAAVAGTLVAAGYAIKKVFDATVGTMVNYADQVRSVQQSTGMSAEESSKLIQVLDDMKVSYEELQKVIQKNGDLFDYSVEGLARMSDEYRALTSAQEKADFMQKRFGKSWISFVETMEQGGAAIRAAGDGISDALVLDQVAIDSAREYQKQIDDLNDSYQALTTTIGVWFLPIVNKMLDIIMVDIAVINNFAGSFGELANIMNYTEPGMERVNALWAWMQKNSADAMNSVYGASDATEENTSIVIENAKALAEQNNALQNFMGNALWLTENQQKYTDDMLSLNDERKREVEVLDQLIAKYGAQSGKVDEQKTKIGELDQKIKDLQTTQKEQTDQWVLKLMEQQGASVEMQMAYAEAAGLITGQSQYAITAIDNLTSQLNDGKITTQEYRDMVAKLIGRIQALDGLEAYADVYVNTHGGVPNFGPSGSAVKGTHYVGGGAAGTFIDGMEAFGGDVKAGGRYMVGERGVEMFVPNQDGTIIPNNQLAVASAGGGTMVVNLTYAPAFSTASRQELLQTITPMLNDWYRNRVTS